MGTNYYLEIDTCHHCGRSEEQLHIGKSSAGWCFTLHVYPERGINTLEDWIPLFAKEKVRDEYGGLWEPSDLIDIISDRYWPEPLEPDQDSVQGPNNLLRHKIGSFCIGHGEGPYDYCVGDFS